MRAITADAGLTFVDLPDPTPGPAEVLIRVAAAGVNRADLLQASGHYQLAPHQNPVLGLEASGHVVAVGDGVSPDLIGSPVNALLDGGGYAELATAPVTQIRILPAGADLTRAAARPESLCTSWFNLVQLTHLQEGETLLVHGGSGGIGHVAIQLGRLLGARVITTAGSEEKVRFCRDLGADEAIDYHDDVESAVADATGGHGADVILDVLGAGGLPGNLRMLASSGRIAVIGLQKGRRGELDLAELMARRGTIVAARLRDLNTREKAVVVSGATTFTRDVQAHLHAAVPFDDAARAHALLDDPETIGKVVLTLG